MSPMISIARRTSGESNGSSPRVHASYCSGVAVRSRMSSIQSVATQPVAPELSMPIDHGTWPSATICSESATSSSQVSGIS